MTEAALTDMFKNASKTVCTSTAVAPPTPSAASSMKTPGNTEDDPNAHKPATEGDIHMEYSSD
jgi:hypothetical protein